MYNFGPIFFLLRFLISLLSELCCYLSSHPGRFTLAGHKPMNIFMQGVYPRSLGFICISSRVAGHLLQLGMISLGS